MFVPSFLLLRFNGRIEISQKTSKKLQNTMRKCLSSKNKKEKINYSKRILKGTPFLNSAQKKNGQNGKKKQKEKN